MQKRKNSFSAKYLTFDTEHTWKALPEFKSTTNSYKEFKEAILKYYPNSTGDSAYKMHNMDSLIGKRQWLGKY